MVTIKQKESDARGAKRFTKYQISRGIRDRFSLFFYFLFCSLKQALSMHKKFNKWLWFKRCDTSETNCIK